MTKAELGCHGWYNLVFEIDRALLHAIAAKYPLAPKDSDKERIRNFIQYLYHAIEGYRVG